MIGTICSSNAVSQYRVQSNPSDWNSYFILKHTYNQCTFSDGLISSIIHDSNKNVIGRKILLYVTTADTLSLLSKMPIRPGLKLQIKKQIKLLALIYNLTRHLLLAASYKLVRIQEGKWPLWPSNK
jgi:hypothetical protein